MDVLVAGPGRQGPTARARFDSNSESEHRDAMSKPLSI